MNIFDKIYESHLRRFSNIPTKKELRKFIKISIQGNPAYNDEAILKGVDVHDVTMMGAKFLKEKGFRITDFEDNVPVYCNEEILKTVDSVDVNIPAMEEKGYAYTKK